VERGNLMTENVSSSIKNISKIRPNGRAFEWGKPFPNEARTLQVSKPSDIQDRAEFELIIPETVGTMTKPQAEDMRLLREVIDPMGYFLKRSVKS